MSPGTFIVIVVIISIIFLSWIRRRNSRWKVPKEPFPKDWRIILIQDVAFYNSLSEEEKKKI